jgi:hypothetical protein
MCVRLLTRSSSDLAVPTVVVAISHRPPQRVPGPYWRHLQIRETASTLVVFHRHVVQVAGSRCRSPVMLGAGREQFLQLLSGTAGHASRLTVLQGGDQHADRISTQSRTRRNVLRAGLPCVMWRPQHRVATGRRGFPWAVQPVNPDAIQGATAICTQTIEPPGSTLSGSFVINTAIRLVTIVSTACIVAGWAGLRV